MPDFDQKNRTKIAEMSKDTAFRDLSREWYTQASRHEYSYHFKWLGRPIIQFPQDIVACQEIAWETKPEIIIECGIARGGSLVFWASILSMLGGGGRVVGIDIDIRAHNREAIESHPFTDRITMIEGSSIDDTVAGKVAELAKGKRTMVALDSMHTKDHVTRELELYAPLVSPGCYLIVFDTAVDHMPDDFYPDRPWGPGNNPRTAVDSFLAANDSFSVDKEIEHKLAITCAPGGYLRRVKE